MGRGSDLTQAGSVDGGLPITKQSRGASDKPDAETCGSLSNR